MYKPQKQILGLITGCVLVLSTFHSFAFEINPERRKDQNLTIPAYFVVPLPYSKPGIGDGFVLLGNVANVAGSTADLNLVQVTGDAGGTIFHSEEIPLYWDWLSLDLQYLDITRANINSYSKRGMSGTSKNDFNIIEVGFSKQTAAKFNLSFFDKKLNFYYRYSEGKNRADALKDSTGALIQTLDFTNSSRQERYEVEFDATDDYLDPRNGLRLGLTYQNHSANDIDDAEFYTIDFKALAYIPMRKNDTLVLNYNQSDAHVTRIGNVDPVAIKIDYCPPANPTCLDAEPELVDSIINERTFGTASELGGDNFLRSYPAGRFKGAHSAFVGAEYRWNIKQEATPFDYFIWKDVRTGVQTAFFVEAASVAEVSSDLWDEVRYTVGAGFRLITGSGGVYRADFATGNEGFEMVIIFDYPWK